MNTGISERRWFVAADERTSRLYRVDRRSAGGLRVELVCEACEDWEPHEHQRPSPRRGKGGHTYAALGNEDEVRRSRFAKSTSEWIEEQIGVRGIPDIVVFAPPRCLGALRKAWPPRVAARVHEHEGELMHLTPSDLSRHRLVANVMGAEQKKGTQSR